MRLIDADELKELIAANVYPVCDAFNSIPDGFACNLGKRKGATND